MVGNGDVRGGRGKHTTLKDRGLFGIPDLRFEISKRGHGVSAAF
jgi:hypothetical protein